MLCDSNWNSQPEETWKAANRWKKKHTTSRREESNAKGWVWACVSGERDSVEKGKLGETSRREGILGNPRKMEQNHVSSLARFSTASGKTTKNEANARRGPRTRHKHSQKSEISQPVKCYCKIISARSECVCVCACLCVKLWNRKFLRRRRKGEPPSERGLNASAARR
jgi:hypothetical protein